MPATAPCAVIDTLHKLITYKYLSKDTKHHSTAPTAVALSSGNNGVLNTLKILKVGIERSHSEGVEDSANFCLHC